MIGYQEILSFLKSEKSNKWDVHKTGTELEFSEVHREGS